ncbi:unnamed protein product, partial [Mesorhabditis belari]|uniref:non-specific serine/threonine protein kinase n=1 Tax=Mesorhabditis belari TaxID=2138241 RepID=A0AAF3FR34_9BILA
MEFEKHWIGRGTFSDVFELVGHHPPAVLKLIHCATDAQRNVYEKEYETLKELEHPNIVGYIRREQIDEYRFGIIMEYCQLGNLKKLVFDPTLIYTMHTVAFWGEQLFGALDYMYRKHKVIHRDIKPENIFAAEDWTLKIGDFGSIKMIEQTCTGTFAGTQRYRSPPQLDENRESWGQMDTSLQDSHRNDVYSLGLILWEIIQRRTVFTEYDVKSGGFNRELFWSTLF